MDIEQFEGRKREHIRHALDPSHQAEGLNGLDQIHLTHEALPEIDLSQVKLAARCLGQILPTPFYIAGMTAGHADAFALNRRLALAAASRGWAMGVGSQRRQLESAGRDTLDEWKRLRDEVPGLVMFANIGLSQLRDVKTLALRELVDAIRAEALVVHANALQEVMQPEGTPLFHGGLAALKRVCAELGKPVVLKETGCGFSRATLDRIARIGLAAVDVSGLGGTHWGRIEGARARENETGSIQARAAATFAGWGESTAEATRAAREALPENTEVWASGGVRSGLDAAKLIALGADRVGYAKPALEMALQGEKELLSWMELQEFELKAALFCTGCLTPREMSRKEGLWKIARS